MKTSRHILRTLICVAVLLAVAFSAFYVVFEIEHDCAGEQCAICQLIEFCKNLLRSPFLVVIVAAFAADKFILHLHKKFRDDADAPSLVSLCVKLSD